MLQPASAVALGLFDGVHIGHRAVLAAAVACQADGLTPAAFTMQTTSVRIKRGEPLRYLYPDDTKQQLLTAAGIQNVVSPPFPEIAAGTGKPSVGSISTTRCTQKSSFAAGIFDLAIGLHGALPTWQRSAKPLALRSN